jgi:hypothetical protein
MKMAHNAFADGTHSNKNYVNFRGSLRHFKNSPLEEWTAGAYGMQSGHIVTLNDKAANLISEERQFSWYHLRKGLPRPQANPLWRPL